MLPRVIRSLSLVCSGQVGVSVRLERLSAARTTGDTAHHSSFVPMFYCWPPPHAALASVAFAAASRSTGLSHSLSLWARRVAPWLTWPYGSWRGQIALHGMRFLRAVSPSLAAARHQP
jgi:hypothetical protein